MAQQFYHGAGTSAGTVVTFAKPVRKIVVTMQDGLGYLNIGTAKSGTKAFAVPQNNTVYLDFQSVNCGKGVKNLLVWAGGTTSATYNISVVEYADSNAGDDNYFM